MDVGYYWMWAISGRGLLVDISGRGLLVGVGY